MASTKPVPAERPRSAQQSGAARRLGAGAGAGRARAPLMSAAGRSWCSGRSPPSSCCGNGSRWSPQARRRPCDRGLRVGLRSASARRSCLSRGRRCRLRRRRRICSRRRCRALLALICVGRMPCFLFAVVWATDIAGLFRRPRARRAQACAAISPKKTWSGAIGGTLGAVVVAAAGDAYIGGFNIAADAVACGTRPVGRRAGRRSVRIRDQAPVRRQGCEPSHSRPWRLDGPARRFLWRRRLPPA